MWLAAVGVGLLLLLPPSYLLIRSLEAPGVAGAVLLAPGTWAAAGRTLLLAAAVGAASSALGLPLAWLTLHTNLPRRRLWLVLVALPLVLPSYISAWLFAAALGPRGLLWQGIGPALGLSRLPSVYGFWGAFIVLTLCAYPYSLLVIRAAWTRLDGSLEAAGRSLGLGPWACFRRVTWPQLRPAVAGGALLAALYVLRDFGAVAIMRYDTLARVIYLAYGSAFDRHTAAVLGLLLVAMALGLVSLERGASRRARLHRAGSHGGRPIAPVALGPWRPVALACCAALTALAVVLPLGILSHWLLRGLAAGERLSGLWPALRGSVTAAALATVLTLVAALPGAWLTVRRPGHRARLLGRLSWTGQALPPLVVALALVFASTRLLPALYQTLPLLLLAYVILFLPEAGSSLQTALRQIHPALGEAARTLGRRPTAVFRTVTLPLARPGLAAAAALVFLTCLRELPATLILSPAGFSTLSISIWSAVSEAYFARAALPALVLVAVSAPPLAWLSLRGEA